MVSLNLLRMSSRSRRPTNYSLLASLREEETAIKARMAAVPAPALDRSTLAKRLNALTGAVARAENEKKQQVASYDKELAALQMRIEKITRAEQTLAIAEKEFAEVQAQLAVAAPPPGALPLFATVQHLQEYLLHNPSVVTPCFSHPGFVSHFTSMPVAAAAGVKEEAVEAKRSAEAAFGVVDVEIELDSASSAPAPAAAEEPTGMLTPLGNDEVARARSRSPVPALLERPLYPSFEASDDAKRRLAEALGSHP